jgi:glycerol uptake facilitator protein
MDFKKILKSINPIALVAEMLGTFGLVYAVLAASRMAAGGLTFVQQSTKLGEVQAAYPGLYVVSVPIVAAFALGLLVAMLGKFSGGHFNPAVTIGMWTVKKIRTAPAIAYLVVQFLGAFAAFGAMQAFMPEAKSLAFSNVAAWKIFAAEALGMFIFVFGISAAISEKRSTLATGTMVGASLLLGIIFAGFVSGAGFLNPAVFMSTVRESLTDLSMGPVFGPILGSILAVWVYSFMESPRLPKKASPKKK